MKVPALRTITVLVGYGFAFAAGAFAADTSATPPAGYFKLTAAGAGDTLLSLPLARRSAWLGHATAVTSTTVTLATAAVVETGATTPAATGSYHAEFVTGPLAGLSYPVLGNVSGTFTLDTQGDDLTAHGLGEIAVGENGDLVRIRAGWTLAEAFGDGANLRLIPSSPLTGAIYKAGDAILLPDNAALGPDPKPAAVFAYVSGEGWRRRGVEGAAGGHTLLLGEPFTVRRQAATAAEILVVGYAPEMPRVVRLPAMPADTDRDVAVAWTAPEPATLAEAGLMAVLTPSPIEPTGVDLLLDYAGAREGFARPPEREFTLRQGHWFEAGVNQDTASLQPGSGYVLRLRGERPVRYWRQGP